MYESDEFKQLDNETFALKINTNRAYKILQLTDMHLGFGIFSKKKDRLALKAVSQIIKRTKPDLIVITGDSVFPFFPKAGTMNNKRQAEIFIRFMDSFGIPYALVYGNHDCEMFARYNKDKLSDVYSSGKYSIFTRVEKTYMEWVTTSLILQTAMEKLYFHLFSLTLICMERVAGSTVVLTVYMKTR